jgi:hypothetical protein
MKKNHLYGMGIILVLLFIVLLWSTSSNSSDPFNNQNSSTNFLFGGTTITHIADTKHDTIAFCKKSKESGECSVETENYSRLLPSSVEFLNTNVVIQTKEHLRKIMKQLSAVPGREKRITNDRITKKEFFIPPTTNFLLQKQLHIFTNMILEILNRNTGYDFQYFNYDRILILTGNQNEKNYIYDVLVQENSKMFQLKLRFDVYVILEENMKNNILTCAQETTPEFPTYPVGIPSEDQLIPLATEVSITSKQVYSLSGINVLKPQEVRELFINHVGIFNSDLVLDPELPTRNYGGVTDGTLENKKIEIPNYTPVQEQGITYNKWITLKEQPKWLHPYPCAAPKLDWNDLGIYPEVKPKYPCVGVRASPFPEPVQAEYYPTLATLPKWSGENAWLFDLATGIPSFPAGHGTNGSS